MSKILMSWLRLTVHTDGMPVWKRTQDVKFDDRQIVASSFLGLKSAERDSE